RRWTGRSPGGSSPRRRRGGAGLPPSAPANSPLPRPSRTVVPSETRSPPPGSEAAMSPERHDTAENSQLFGRYRIRGLLGEGGLGRLYLAEQTGIEGFTKIVTLKRILPQLADSAAFRTLFLNEARVAARLEHPNVVATYEF